MQVILIQDVDNLGGANELATVKNGYDMLTIQAEENWIIWNE